MNPPRTLYTPHEAWATFPAPQAQVPQYHQQQQLHYPQHQHQPQQQQQYYHHQASYPAPPLPAPVQRRHRTTPPEERHALIALVLSGRTISSAAAELNLPQATASRIIRQYKERGHASPLPPPGRPHKLDPRTQAAILRDLGQENAPWDVFAQRYDTTPAIVRRLALAHGVDASRHGKQKVLSDKPHNVRRRKGFLENGGKV